MNPDRWRRVEALFDAAIEMVGGERRTWLEDACGEDRDLHREVEQLLAAHARPAGILDRPMSLVIADDTRQRLEAALVGRYELERELGSGGMATVFLAHELKHGRRVVLKVLRPLLASPSGVERFRREVRMLARLTHPHILGLIDSGEVEGLFYYVMPWVEGETLADLLQRRHRLPLGEALVLLRDIAGAMAHAHRNDIVHRDLKPENVLCVGGHAYVMDFGIAKLMSPETTGGRLTDEWTAIGTPAYMAPEQMVPGAPIDHRADIYAFGLMAREMFTGKMAQGGFRDGPEVFRSTPSLDGVPGSLKPVIAECLVNAPAKRLSSTDDLVGRLRGSDLSEGPTEKPRWRWPLAVGVLVTLAALVWALFKLRPPAAVSDLLPLPIAVTTLSNQTGDSTADAWGRLAGDWITQGLQEAGIGAVVSWPSALHATERHRQSGEGTPLAAFVARETGAATVITGQYYSVGDSVRFLVQFNDARTGRLLGAPAPVVARADSAARGIRELRERVMGTAALLRNPRTGALDELTRHPPTYLAYQAFDRGLERYRAQDYEAAQPEFDRAYQLDTTFVPALVYGAIVAWNRGAYGQFDSMLQRISPRLSQLGTYHQRLFDFMVAARDGDGEAAYQAILRAARLAPGSAAGYNLALVALQTDRPAEAVEALKRIDPDSSALQSWGPYWTQLAHGEHLLGAHQKELEAARALKIRHPDSRVALVLEARALAALGRVAEIDSIVSEARALPPRTYWSQGAALVVAGEELLAHGDSMVGLRFLSQAVAWLKLQLGAAPGDRAFRYWLGSAYYDLGRWSQASEVLDPLAAEFANRHEYSWMAALARARRGLPVTVDSLVVPFARERGSYLVYRARLQLIHDQAALAAGTLAEAVRLGVDGLPWYHASGWRDFRQLNRELTPFPASFAGGRR